MLTETDLLDLIRAKGIDIQIHKHEALFTVEDQETGRNRYSHKNLFLRTKKVIFLFSCDENASIDLKRFKSNKC